MHKGHDLRFQYKERVRAGGGERHRHKQSYSKACNPLHYDLHVIAYRVCKDVEDYIRLNTKTRKYYLVITILYLKLYLEYMFLHGTNWRFNLQFFQMDNVLALFID